MMRVTGGQWQVTGEARPQGGFSLDAGRKTVYAPAKAVCSEKSGSSRGQVLVQP